MNYTPSLLWLLALLLTVGCTKPTPPCCEPNPNAPAQYGAPYENVPQQEDVVMYEINPLVFSSSRDLAGITERLDSIKNLGVNVIWLMPIYEKGILKSVGSPYCISNFKALNPNYGTLHDLRALVDSAHSKGMAVLLDWVANHTSWDHVWMDNPDYYYHENGVIVHPPGTNWEDVAELDYSNPDMRAAMIEAMRYWVLEANIDGYRCDYATGVPEGFWKAAIDSLRAIPGRELLMFAESDNLNLLNQGFDMAFSWNLYGTALGVFSGSDARNLYAAHASEFSGLAPGKTMVRFITNHDQHAWDNTPQVLFGGQKQAMAAFVAQTTLGGIPLIYNGQEIAIPYKLPFFTPTSIAINWNLNPAVRKTYAQFLDAYNHHDALRGNDRTDFSTFNICAFTSVGNSSAALVAVNVRNTAVNFSLPTDWQQTAVWDALAKDSVNLSAQLALSPFEYAIFIHP